MDSYWYQISFGRGRDIRLLGRYDITIDNWNDLYDWCGKLTEAFFAGIKIGEVFSIWYFIVMVENQYINVRLQI